MSIDLGKTYTFMQPPADPECADQSCELDSPSMIFPWVNLLGKRVTVTETGHTYAGHPAVKVTYGPVDWHPNVMVTLTGEQLQALGILQNPAAGYLIVGRVWAVDSADTPVLPGGDVDDFPYETAHPIEMPKQHTEIIPARCLRDTAVSADVKRREERIRRLAKTHRLRLRKIRGGMSGHSTGPYLLVDDRHGWTAVAGDPRWKVGVSLDEIEAALAKQRERQS